MSVDAVIIGAGQAGLAAAWHLQRAGISFRILDAAERPGGAWRSYYDSLTLFSPAAYSSLPGLPFPGEADAYPKRDDVVRYLENYVKHFDIPVETGRRVKDVSREAEGFRVVTETGKTIDTRGVISASGAFAEPHLPRIEGLDAFQGKVLHSADYRSPQGFESQRVVVIGGANSAVQIAYELAKVADVTLATRRRVQFVPQRLLGKDFHFWLRVTGLDHTQWLNDQSTPVLDDGTYRCAVNAGKPVRRAMFTRVTANGVEWSDGTREKVDVLLFATGFRPRLPYLNNLNAIAPDGRLNQRKGICTTTPGLYFAGFPRQRNFASATLRGVGPDAGFVVQHLQNFLGQSHSHRAAATP